MNFRLIKIFVLFSFLVLSLTGCASGQLGKSKTFNHNTPLIKEKNIISENTKLLAYT